MKAVMLLLALAAPLSANEPIWYWNFKIADGSGVSFTDDAQLRDCMKVLLPVVLRDGTPIESWPNSFVVTGIGPEALKHAHDIWTRQAPEKNVFPLKTQLSLVIRGVGRDTYELKDVARDYDVFTVNYSVVPKPENLINEGSDSIDVSHYPWASIAIISIGNKLTIGKYEVHAGEICKPFIFEVK